jgi:DNA-binding MarR family transcriptional regulator
MTIAEVCKVLRVESATVSTLVVRMERDGLIQKEQSPHDKRASILKPTDRATGLARQADQLMAIEAADITHRLSGGEQAQLIALLERVLGNLSTAHGS